MGTGQSSPKDKSLAYTKQVAEIVGEVVTKEIQNCAVYVNAKQNIVVSGSNSILSDVQQVQTFAIKADCVQNNKVIANMQSAIDSKIDQASNMQSSGKLLPGSDAGTIARANAIAKNHIRNVVNTQSLQDCITNINAAQVLTVAGDNNVIKNVVQSQAANAIRSCVQSKITTTDFVNNISAEIQNSSNLQTRGIGDTFGDVAKAGIGAVSQYYNQPYIIAMLFIVVLFIGFVIYMFVNRGRGVDVPVQYANSPNNFNSSQQRVL